MFRASLVDELVTPSVPTYKCILRSLEGALMTMIERDGLRALLARERAVENWLQERVGRTESRSDASRLH